jgi:diacylglycerol kinase
MFASFRYATAGLHHALQHERNLRLFLGFYILLLVAAAWFKLLAWEWAAILISGLLFIAVELLNTALERLTDAVDVLHKQQGIAFHAGLKATKDVAAAGSLISLIAFIVTVCIVFAPYVGMAIYPYL